MLDYIIIMKKAFAVIGISSSVVTILINLLPDDAIGTKIFLYIVFGLIVFGISWAIVNISKLLGGLVFGVILGILVGACLAAIDYSLTEMPATATFSYDFILSLKWILPILSYTFFGVDPWRTKPIL